MVSSFSPNRAYEEPGTGDQTDTWGPTVNGNFTTIDLNISGTQAISLASSNVTLTSGQAKNMAFALTGVLTAAVSLIFPAAGTFMIVSNLTTGTFPVTVLTSAGGSTGVVVPQGKRSLLYSNGTDVRFADDGSAAPIGSGMDFWGTTAPAGYLFPYGQAISRTIYAGLFAVLGTTYGAGDGSTTFNMPDKRDRASYGKGNMGGTSAGRITASTEGWAGNTLGAAGGLQSHVLTDAQNGPHIHSGTTGGESNTHQHPVDTAAFLVQVQAGTGINVVGSLGSASSGTENQTHTHAFTTAIAGTGQPHNNLPPGIVCNYVIYAGV